MLEPFIDKFLKSLTIINSSVEELSIFLLGKYADCLPSFLLAWLLVFGLAMIVFAVELGSQY